MWALICDEEDGELRVVPEDIARDSYLRGKHFFGKWKLRTTNADEEVLLHMARMTGWYQETFGDVTVFSKSA